MSELLPLFDVADTPWLDIAKREKGTKEVLGIGNNPRVIEYHKCTTLKGTADSIPWCAAFVCWCLQQVSYKHTRSAAARSYATYGTPCEMTLGCIAVFTREGGGHVGFVVAWDDAFIQVLGGNQQDEVNVRKYPRSRLLATRWPVKGTN